MRRTGKIAAINSQRAMVAIATEDDGFTIVEILSPFDVEVGDQIAWSNGYGLGPEFYENLTKNTREEVYVQNHSVSNSNLRQQLLL